MSNRNLEGGKKAPRAREVAVDDGGAGPRRRPRPLLAQLNPDWRAARDSINGVRRFDAPNPEVLEAFPSVVRTEGLFQGHITAPPPLWAVTWEAPPSTPWQRRRPPLISVGYLVSHREEVKGRTHFWI